MPAPGWEQFNTKLRAKGYSGDDKVADAQAVEEQYRKDYNNRPPTALSTWDQMVANDAEEVRTGRDIPFEPQPVVLPNATGTDVARTSAGVALPPAGNGFDMSKQKKQVYNPYREIELSDAAYNALSEREKALIDYNTAMVDARGQDANLSRLAHANGDYDAAVTGVTGIQDTRDFFGSFAKPDLGGDYAPNQLAVLQAYGFGGEDAYNWENVAANRTLIPTTEIDRGGDAFNLDLQKRVLAGDAGLREQFATKEPITDTGITSDILANPLWKTADFTTKLGTYLEPVLEGMGTTGRWGLTSRGAIDDALAGKYSGANEERFASLWATITDPTAWGTASYSDLRAAIAQDVNISEWDDFVAGQLDQASVPRDKWESSDLAAPEIDVQGLTSWMGGS